MNVLLLKALRALVQRTIKRRQDFYDKKLNQDEGCSQDYDVRSCNIFWNYWKLAEAFIPSLKCAFRAFEGTKGDHVHGILKPKKGNAKSIVGQMHWSKWCK